jgi:hypothetical protein
MKRMILGLSQGGPRIPVRKGGDKEMSEYLTMEEIKKRFPDEWVLLEDPEKDNTLKVLGGILVEHGEDDKEILGRAKLRPPKNFAFFYTGEPDPDVAYLL